MSNSNKRKASSSSPQKSTTKQSTKKQPTKKQKKSTTTKTAVVKRRTNLPPILSRFKPETLKHVWTMTILPNVRIVSDSALYADWFDPETTDYCWRVDNSVIIYQNEYAVLSLAHDATDIDLDMLKQNTSKLSIIQLALWMKEKRLCPSGQNTSHLCHNKWCVNIQHLLWEKISDNSSRNFCVCWVLCNCGCNQRINACAHKPRCLRRSPQVNF